MYRRRRLTAAAVLLVVVVGAILAVNLLIGGGGGTAAQPPAPGAAPRPGAATAVSPTPEGALPGGATRILPDHRVVTLYGSPGDPEAGALGTGTPAEAAQRLRDLAAGYAGGDRPVLPALHPIASSTGFSPGEDGTYRTRMERPTIRAYLDAARAAGAILILDIQPGRASIRDEVTALRAFLGEPDVSLAIDPEWAMGPDQVPGRDLGSVDASVVNWAAAYLAGIVRDGDLPQKLLIVHQFSEAMIRDRDALQPRPGVALVVDVDPFGTRQRKTDIYGLLTRDAGRWGHGFKLFNEEDEGLMTPAQVLALRPAPDLVVHE